MGGGHVLRYMALGRMLQPDRPHLVKGRAEKELSVLQDSGCGEAGGHLQHPWICTGSFQSDFNLVFSQHTLETYLFDSVCIHHFQIPGAYYLHAGEAQIPVATSPFPSGLRQPVLTSPRWQLGRDPGIEKSPQSQSGNKWPFPLKTGTDTH